VAIVPSPSAVLAPLALVLAVPPSAMAMGEDRPLIVPPVMFTFPSLIVTVGSPSWLSDAAVTSTPVANVNPRVKRWLPKLNHWTIWGSVDGIGERTEYIRYPSNWNKIVENLTIYKNLIKEKQNGRIVFSPAIQIMNIDQLDDLLYWFLEFSENKWNLNYNLSWMAQVWYPKMLNYDVAPIDYKLKIADKLEKSRTKFLNTSEQFLKYYDGHIRNLRTDNISDIERKYLLQNFIKYNDQQDKFRGKTTWRALLPDLEKSIKKFLF